MHPQLAEWAQDPAIAHVVVRAAGEKAFCAGGDIRQLARLGGRQATGVSSISIARNTGSTPSYKRYPKPYVALIDGIVMGGGVGGFSPLEISGLPASESYSPCRRPASGFFPRCRRDVVPAAPAGGDRNLAGADRRAAEAGRCNLVRNRHPCRAFGAVSRK